MADPHDARLPIAVLVSGSGSNLQAIIDASSDPLYAAEIAVVISDRPDVFALRRAGDAGIPTAVVDWRSATDRASFSAAVCDVADAHGAGLLVLAGFMRILAPNAIARFPNRIVNTHPALLPAFPGAHAVPEAIAHGVKITGVTIHFVDEEVDHGPIILQVPVAVEDGDDEVTLQKRIQAVEHEVYPVVIDAFARGRLRVDGRSVTWKEML